MAYLLTYVWVIVTVVSVIAVIIGMVFDAHSD